MPPKAIISVINNVECKICKTCKKHIPLIDYHKCGKYNDGTQKYMVHCKECRNRTVLGHKSRNPIIFQEGKKGRICEKCKKWKSEDECYKRPSGILRSECIQCKREYSQKYIKRIRKDEPEKYQKLLRKKVKFRQTNIHAKISGNLRTRVTQVLKRNPKAETTMNLVGCSLEHLKTHLEEKFSKGMTWENYGKNGWHVDHKIPCAAFDLHRPDEQKRCFNWRNLQPMWESDNLSKSDSYTFDPVLEIALVFPE